MTTEGTGGEMQIRVLGPVDVVDDDERPVSLRGPAQTRVLAILVAASNQPVAVTDIAAALWRDADLPEDPTRSIRTSITRIRQAVGADGIVTGNGTYRLDGVATDLEAFTNLIDRARRSSGSPAAAGLWRQALGLWRGRAFGDCADMDLVRAEAKRVEELRAEATEAWFDARLAAGEGRELTADLETAVEEFPLREGFRAQQMTVLARAGRTVEALRAFQDFRSDLTTVGLEPSPRLADLDGQIAAGQVPNAGARRTLRGYQVGERLGEGAFAVVHRATQTSLGRDVAIKQIRAELADQPDFIRQFEAEAHLVARLEHPHIVPLYDYWRQPGSAYLVMRHLIGGSLQGRIYREELRLEEVVPIMSQVASGLEAAHAANVVHRDVKPANILLDAEGNGYLSDFGIAVEEQERLDPQAWLSNGSPAYAPPEQLQRQPVGPTADIYALGVATYEALTGELPFRAETTLADLLKRQLTEPLPLVRTSRPEMPAAVDAVLQKATAKRPVDRYQSATSFRAALMSAADITAAPEFLELEDRNPYKGLSAFDEADAADFVGRDRLVNRLLATISQHRITAVVGPSGSGKSSAVRAGLLPAVRTGQVSGSAQWFVAVMSPGPAPFQALEAALMSVAVSPPADLETELRDDPRNLARLLHRILPSDRELLLVVDQLEELFSLGQPGEGQRFLDALALATVDEGSRLRVVATIRADFFDHPLRHAAFARLIETSTVMVHPLAADELERAITEPARSVGIDFEAGLIAQITADVADQPGALPLLQYALTELFDRRNGRLLTQRMYSSLGGVAGALGRRAEDLFIDMSGSDQDAVRRLMRRLVVPGETTSDTRRRALRAEVDPDGRAAVPISAFGSARLLSFDRDQATREPTVEVAHEALLTEWPRLQQWLDEDRGDRRVLQHLTEASGSWETRGRLASDLYRGTRLESALALAAQSGNELTPTEQQFLDHSEQLQTEERDAERRHLRRLRRALAVVAAIALVAAAASVAAVRQRSVARAEAARAEEQTIIAVERQQESEIASLVATSLNLLDEDPVLAGLVAIEAHRHDPSIAAPALLAALQATSGLRSSNTWGGPVSEAVCGAIGPSGVTITPRDIAGSIWLIPSGGEPIGAGVDCLTAISPDGSMVVGARGASEFVAWDTATGQERFVTPLRSGVLAIEFSPDGKFIAVVHDRLGSGFAEGASLEIFDAESGASIPDQLVDVVRPQDIRWLPDSRHVVVGSKSDGFGAMLAVHGLDGDVVRVDTGPSSVVAVDVSDDGLRIATVDVEGTATIWTTADLASVAEIRNGTPDELVMGASLSGTGDLLALHTTRGSIDIVNTTPGAQTRNRLRLPFLAIDTDIEDGGEGNALLTVLDERGTVSTYDLQHNPLAVDTLLVPQHELRRADSDVVFMPQGQGPEASLMAGSQGQVLIADTNNRVRTVDLDSGAISSANRTPPGLFWRAEVIGYAPLADGGLATMQPDSKSFFIYRPGAELVELPLTQHLTSARHPVRAVSDGQSTAALIVRDPPADFVTERGRLPERGVDHIFVVDTISASWTEAVLPEGTLATTMVVRSDGVVVVGLEDGAIGFVRGGVYEQGPTIEPGSAVTAIAQLGDDVVVTVKSGTLFRVGLDHSVEELANSFSGVVDLQVLPWSSQLVTTDAFGDIRLWTEDGANELGLLHPGAGVPKALPVVDRERELVWVPGFSGTLQAVSTDPSSWVDALCALSDRRLTAQERQTFLPLGLQDGAESTCP